MTLSPKARLASGLLPSLVLMLSAAACAPLSLQEEEALGREVQREARRSFTLMRDPLVVNYIRDMGRELADAAEPPPPFQIDFYVVEDEALNAFAVPGGAIYVHTGLIESVEKADELASVIAHEIGHVTKRHSAMMYRRQRNTAIAGNILGGISQAALGGYAGEAAAMASSLATHAYGAQYTRDYERDADRVAVDLMLRAGWDPNGMLRMFETLQREGGGSRVPIFLSTHPPTDERIGNVRSHIAEYGVLTGEMRQDDRGKLPIIQRRLELIVGTESELDPFEDENRGDEDGDAAEDADEDEDEGP